MENLGGDCGLKGINKGTYASRGAQYPESRPFASTTTESDIEQELPLLAISKLHHQQAEGSNIDISHDTKVPSKTASTSQQTSERMSAGDENLTLVTTQTAKETSSLGINPEADRKNSSLRHKSSGFLLGKSNRKLRRRHHDHIPSPSPLRAQILYSDTAKERSKLIQTSSETQKSAEVDQFSSDGETLGSEGPSRKSLEELKFDLEDDGGAGSCSSRGHSPVSVAAADEDPRKESATTRFGKRVSRFVGSLKPRGRKERKEPDVAPVEIDPRDKFPHTGNADAAARYRHLGETTSRPSSVLDEDVEYCLGWMKSAEDERFVDDDDDEEGGGEDEGSWDKFIVAPE
ncbi:hypothetical protein DFH27DRAFT_570411 [Peziza echinospora]|nr:hypothetical protein DFH27DRAFT_570411 [Peziza echinospora]